jgi:hypothetical protein
VQAFDGAAHLVGVDPRLDPDRGQLDRLRAERGEPPGELAGLRPRRVTTTRLPWSGRRSSQAIRSRRAATGPMTVTEGGPIPASEAASAISASRPETTRWSGKVPRSTTNAGSSAERPESISRSAIRGSAFTPM